MGTRGRKSGASLSVVAINVAAQRPEPPSDLTDAQAKVWRETVDTTPAGWFRPGDALLTAYCRHVVTAAFLANIINDCQPDIDDRAGIRHLDKLLAMHARETAATSSLARAMRLTKQAQVHPRTAGRAFGAVTSGAKPWEI